MAITIAPPKDYRSLSPEELAEWIEAEVASNQSRAGLHSYWQPKTEKERLLTAIVSSCADDSYGFSLIFGRSKTKLISYDPRRGWIELSRYALADWDLAFDAIMQIVAELLTGYERETDQWHRAVAKLGASPKLRELVVRDPLGRRDSMATPYGPLDFTVGRTQFHTEEGLGGVVIAANRELITIEAKDGSIHRLRAERLHPDSGRLDRVIRRIQTFHGESVHFGESYVEKDGKRYYAIEWISHRVMALAKDGSRLTPLATELRL